MHVTIEISIAWLNLALALTAALFLLGVFVEWPNVDWRGAIRAASLPLDLWMMWQIAKIMWQIARAA